MKTKRGYLSLFGKSHFKSKHMQKPSLRIYDLSLFSFSKIPYIFNSKTWTGIWKLCVKFKYKGDSHILSVGLCDHTMMGIYNLLMCTTFETRARFFLVCACIKNLHYCWKCLSYKCNFTDSMHIMYTCSELRSFPFPFNMKYSNSIKVHYYPWNS